MSMHFGAAADAKGSCYASVSWKAFAAEVLKETTAGGTSVEMIERNYGRHIRDDGDAQYIRHDHRQIRHQMAG